MEHSPDKLEIGVEAAARALHDMAREKRGLRWETCSQRFRADMKAFVRPLVVAALQAVDAPAGHEPGR